MRSLLTTIGEIVCIGVASYGFWTWEHPAGFIAAGVLGFAYCVAAAA